MKPCRLVSAFLATALLTAAGLDAAPLDTAARQAIPERPFRHPAPALCKPPVEFPVAPAAESPAPATGDRGCDILSYDLELRLDPGDRSLVGAVVISFAAFQPIVGAGLDTLRLDLVADLAVESVSDPTGPLAFARSGERLDIALREPLAAGLSDTVTVAWSGRPPRHGSFLAGLMYRTHDPGTPADPSDDVPIVANLSQTWSAHSWWPCKDHPSDKALVSLAVTVPDSLSAVSNGTLEAVSDPAPGWRRYAWREQYPLPTYLVSVAASNYESWSESCVPVAGPPVRLDYHLFPEDRAAGAYDLALSCEMMSFLTGLLGPWPYPGEKYAQVEFKWVGGMEHTTATSLAQLLFTGDRRQENLFLHEMVHQWFGDSLTPTAWADIWLNEGFARYGEALWVEHSYGAEAYAEFMALIGPGRHPELFRGDGVLADPVPILPNLLVYDKGAWVLHMLRGMLGDDGFFAFLRDYATDPALVHGSVTTDDLRRAADAAAGRDLAGFFDPWLNTDLAPVIAHTATGLGSRAVELTLTQHQSPVFEVPVPVVLHAGCGDVAVVARLTAERQVFRWELACPIDSLSVNPDGLALIRTLNSPPPPVLVRGPVPNPTAGGAEFTLFLTETSEVFVKIYDAQGRLVASEALGVLTETGPEGAPIAPAHRWRWEPDAGGGPRLPAGLYFVEVRGAGGRQVRRLTRLH